MSWVRYAESLPAASTKGDIAVYNGSAWVVVSAGANDTVLTADSAQSAGVKWAAGGGGGGGSGSIAERVDTPPGSPNAMDDEFDDDSFNSTLWSELNNSGPVVTISEEKSALVFTSNENADQARGVYQSAPSGDWTIEAKIIEPADIGAGAAPIQATLFAAASTSGIVYECGWWNDGEPNIRALSRSSPTSSASSWGTEQRLMGSGLIYLRMSWDDTGGTISFDFSHDGVSWRGGMEGSTGGGWTPGIVGLGYTNRRNAERIVTFDWFRRTA